MDKSLPSILHAIDTTGPGGAETVFLDLTENLTLPGYRSIAIIKGPGWVEDKLKARGIHYYIVKPESGFSLAYYRQLIRIIRENNVRLIQAHLLGSTLTYSLIALLLRIPLVATLHGRVDVNPNERLIFLKNLIMKLGVSRLVTVSQDLADYIEARGLFSKQDIRVIYNGVDVAKYGKNTLQDIRQQLQLEDDAILIGSVGNVRPAKAYHVLIDAAKEVVAHNPKVHFVIAGHKKPELMARLDDQIKRANLCDNVHFIGFQQDSAAFLGQMDIFALSSSSEGFSISTIEAMATGLPVLATRCGGPEEIILNEDEGLLIPKDNIQALADGIITLIRDTEMRVKLSEGGRRRAHNSFSMTQILSRYEREYLNLLSHP